MPIKKETKKKPSGLKKLRFILSDRTDFDMIDNQSIGDYHESLSLSLSIYIYIYIYTHTNSLITY